jgi:hypothetical protein
VCLRAGVVVVLGAGVADLVGGSALRILRARAGLGLVLTICLVIGSTDRRGLVVGPRLGERLLARRGPG